MVIFVRVLCTAVALLEALASVSCELEPTDLLPENAERLSHFGTERRFLSVIVLTIEISDAPSAAGVPDLPSLYSTPAQIWLSRLAGCSLTTDVRR